MMMMMMFGGDNVAQSHCCHLLEKLLEGPPPPPRQLQCGARSRPNNKWAGQTTERAAYSGPGSGAANAVRAWRCSRRAASGWPAGWRLASRGLSGAQFTYLQRAVALSVLLDLLVQSLPEGVRGDGIWSVLARSSWPGAGARARPPTSGSYAERVGRPIQLFAMRPRRRPQVLHCLPLSARCQLVSTCS